MRLRLGFLVILIMGLLAGTPAVSSADAVSSEESPPDSREVLKRGTVEAGVMVGFWQGITFIGDAPSANRSAIYALPQLGLVLNEGFDAGYFSGNVTFMVEPLAAYYYQPFGATAFGGSLVAKYNFLSFGRWVPFWDAGMGMLWTNLAPDIPEQSTQFNFVLQTGPGVQYLLNEYYAFTLGLRFHHISNANIGERNTGLNAILAYLGLSFFPGQVDWW